MLSANKQGAICQIDIYKVILNPVQIAVDTETLSCKILHSSHSHNGHLIGTLVADRLSPPPDPSFNLASLWEVNR